jgi:hypothetical protein
MRRKLVNLLQDRVREDAPRQKKNRNCLDYNKDLFMSPRGAPCQDELTDRQLQSTSGSDRYSIIRTTNMITHGFQRTDSGTHVFDGDEDSRRASRLRHRVMW